MADGYVFDTEPLIAYLYDEPGADEVTRLLEQVDSDEADGAVSHATATEIVYKVARLEAKDGKPSDDELGTGERDLRVLRGFGLSVETPPWRLVARVKASGGISLGDSYATALAVENDASLVVGADPEFDDVPVDVNLHRIREG